MIITKRCQMFLRFQNNIEDLGMNGLSWSEVGGSSQYNDTDGFRGIDFNSNRYLSAGRHVNPFNITNEYTLLYKVYGDTGSSFLDLGSYFASGTQGSGLSFQISNASGVTPRIEQKTASGYNGSSHGRWATNIFPVADTWNTIVVRRKLNFADVFLIANGELEYNSVTFTSTLLNNWGNRTYAISALFAGGGDSLWASYNVYTRTLGLWNKYLDDSDVKRIQMGLHPLNG